MKLFKGKKWTFIEVYVAIYIQKDNLGSKTYLVLTGSGI